MRSPGRHVKFQQIGACFALMIAVSNSGMVPMKMVPQTRYQDYVEAPYSPYSGGNPYKPVYAPPPAYQPGYPKEPPPFYPPQVYKKPDWAALCDFSTGSGPGDYKLQGKLTLTQNKGYYGNNSPVYISGVIGALTPGQHGMHIHVWGDFSDVKNGCVSAGPHYNPDKVNHGAPTDPPYRHHAGDLGNIQAGYDGLAVVNIAEPDISIADSDAKHPVAGRAIVVHAKVDDLGRGNSPESPKTGDSGSRVGCCLIVKVDPESV